MTESPTMPCGGARLDYASRIFLVAALASLSCAAGAFMKV